MDRKYLMDDKGIAAFAQHFKEIRKKYGFSQEELALESGITLSQIARLETGRINMGISSIFLLARTMKVPLPELFNFELP